MIDTKGSLWYNNKKGGGRMKHRHTLNYLLTPEYVFNTYKDVTPEFLTSLGIKALLIDIDNTHAPYEQDLPDEDIIAWFDALKNAGIKAALISNNHPPRVELFNSKLGLPAFADCHKPSPKRLREYAKAIDAEIEKTSALGDQIFTDVWGAKKIGARAIIVPPIRDKKTLFFRFKRWLEKPFIRKYKKLHKEI
jgi:HAD superfamily phosphatase (TIGR01668 family)